MFTSAVLQWIAVITMLIDHVGYYLLNDFEPFRMIGRLAMPLFIFMLVEGFKKTSSRPRYFARIFVTALIAEIPVYLLHISVMTDYYHNILFTMLLSFLALYATEKGKFWFVAVPLVALAASAFNCEYGAFGVMLAVGFYLVNKYSPKQIFVRFTALLAVLLVTMIPLASYENWPIQLWSICAVIPLALYNGKKGQRLPRYFLYAFYPAHLFAIWLLTLVLH